MTNIKKCKKCGAEVPSDTKYNLCANCTGRGERANKIRWVGGIVITGVISALSIVSRKGFINNIDDISGQDMNGMDDDQGSI